MVLIIGKPRKWWVNSAQIKGKAKQYFMERKARGKLYVGLPEGFKQLSSITSRTITFVT